MIIMSIPQKLLYVILNVIIIILLLILELHHSSDQRVVAVLLHEGVYSCLVMHKHVPTYHSDGKGACPNYFYRK